MAEKKLTDILIFPSIKKIEGQIERLTEALAGEILEAVEKGTISPEIAAELTTLLEETKKPPPPIWWPGKFIGRPPPER